MKDSADTTRKAAYILDTTRRAKAGRSLCDRSATADRAVSRNALGRRTLDIPARRDVKDQRHPGEHDPLLPRP